MAFFKLTLGYDGTDFSGWQVQPGRRTVQGVVEDAWLQITGESVHVTAASRTDAGVHALGQVIGIQTATHLTAEELHRALNANLPADVVMRSVEQVRDGFHATRDAVGKRYRYQIHNDRLRPLFERQCVWHLPAPLDEVAMHKAGQKLLGEHDFASFQSAGSPRESTFRTIRALEVSRTSHAHLPQIWIEIEGDGFLYNMVRIIVGTLVDVGQGRRDESWLAEVLSARDRRQAGKTAPPEGLFLLQVYYNH